MQETAVTYPNVEPQPSFPALEERVLARWEDEATFEASVQARPAGEHGANEYVFYDGPPFANGLPHYGHLLTGYVKDAVPRYQTMKGHRVERRFGWDCHGLPAEVEAERQLGLSGHREIEDFGIGAFNDACRASVLRYTQEWERYVTRQARWVDFEHDYKTLDLTYMESVMWAFKRLWDKGFVYEGYRVLPYCWRCETPLSNTELRMDDAYLDRQDPAVTVAFELEPREGEARTRVLVWTTTPWTLPSNLALAVGRDIEYAVFEEAGVRYLLADARVPAYESQLAQAERVGTVRGGELVGRRYTPLYPFFAGTPNAFVVLEADFVSTEDGTGVVHLAPGFGEDDQKLCEAHGIPVICPIDSTARFTAEVPSYVGLQVFDANPEVVRDLKARGLLVRHDSYDHAYPHCWRCARPLVYRAVSSWFVQVTAFRDRMVELNQQIRWVPEHVRDGSFGKWLENARDWSISRNRYWGSPVPVWKCDDPAYPRVDVYGSLAELERDFRVAVTDLHRPMVDELVRPNPDDPTGRSMMRRVPETLDCWFESGSMPFAQVHYPFENTEWFEHHYPGDFIVEYLAQTRGWFYTLHVLATALFDRPSFSNCMAHGIVLGNDGQKMSKSLRNYPDPYEMFDTYGSDAMRWMLLSSAVLRGNDVIVTEQAIRDAVRQVVLPLWNAWYFLSLYANAAGPGQEATRGRFRVDQTVTLDRYLLAKLHDLVATVTAQMDAYDLFGACASVRAFLDVLTNWYIRRSRDRFWAAEQDAFDTLHTGLHVLTRVVAPLLPLVTEEVYQGLTGEASVHLTDWPDAATLPADDDLVAAMDEVRDVVSAALSLRKARGLRVRLPLASLTVAAADAARLEPFLDLVRDEVNVKEVRLEHDPAHAGVLELQVRPAVCGPRLGPDTQRVIQAVKAGDWTDTDGRVVAGGIELLDGEYTVRLLAADPERSAVLPGQRGLVLLDTTVTPELQREGMARDLVRVVQQARREAKLDVSDRVRLTVEGPPEVASVLGEHGELIRNETLAVELLSEPAGEGAFEGEVGEGLPVRVAVARQAAS
jgi:isoleucyl-tRNA synthetase